MRISVDPRLDLELARSQAGAAKLRQKLPTEDKGKLRETAEQFESLLVEQLVQEMRKSVHKSDLFGNREHESLFEEMLDGEYAQHIARHGGLGVADMLMAQWTRAGVKK